MLVFFSLAPIMPFTGKLAPTHKIGVVEHILDGRVNAPECIVLHNGQLKKTSTLFAACVQFFRQRIYGCTRKSIENTKRRNRKRNCYFQQSSLWHVFLSAAIYKHYKRALSANSVLMAARYAILEGREICLCRWPSWHFCCRFYDR